MRTTNSNNLHQFSHLTKNFTEETSIEVWGVTLPPPLSQTYSVKQGLQKKKQVN